MMVKAIEKANTIAEKLLSIVPNIDLHIADSLDDGKKFIQVKLL